MEIKLISGILYKLSVISIISLLIYLVLGLKSALIFSLVISIVLLAIGFAVSAVAIFKFGSQVIIEVDLNFYEALVCISSLGLPIATLTMETLT